MTNKNTPQEMGKELVESSAVAGAVKREAQSSLAVGYFTGCEIDPVYYQICVDRLNGEYDKGSLI